MRDLLDVCSMELLVRAEEVVLRLDRVVTRYMHTPIALTTSNRASGGGTMRLSPQADVRGSLPSCKFEAVLALSFECVAAQARASRFGPGQLFIGNNLQLM